MSLMKPLLQTGSAITTTASNGQEQWRLFWKTFRNQAADEAKIVELESEVGRLRELSKENERLRKLLEFKDTFAGKKVAARIIGWDPAPWRKTIILDKGANQGIKKDMAVIVPDGLVGRVLEVGPSTSRVILLTDADSRVSAIAEESRSQGVLSGNGNSELTLEYMEIESTTIVGESVSTSGLNGLFPKGIRIGKITAIGKDMTGLHLQAKVTSFVRFSKLEEVLCLAASREK